MNSSPIIKMVILILCVLFILVLEVLIGFYVYTVLKTDFREQFVREVRRGVCKEEFKTLLRDKENLKNICDVVGCKVLEPFNDKWYPMYPGSALNRQKRYVPTTDIFVPLAVPDHIVPSKTGPSIRVNPYKPTSPPCSPGPPGPPGAPGPRGPIGLRGQKGPKGDTGSPGLKGRDGQPGVQGLKGERGSTGQNGKEGLIGPRGLPGQCNACETKHERRNESVIVKKFDNKMYSSFRTNKSAECPSTVIGKREILGNIDEAYTSFMVDSRPPSTKDGYKYWATTNDTRKLFEFDDMGLFIKNKPSTVYDLDVPFDGNAHVVYNGLFFYKVNGSNPKIIKYNIKNGKNQTLIIPDLPKYIMKHLYFNSYNFFDFSVDQNGLWVIFSILDHTAVAKINHESMIIECMWEISLKNNKVIDMFVASGTLYTLEFTPTFDVEIHLAINLDLNTVNEVNIGGIHQSGGITMATYDYRNSQLLLVDDGKKVVHLFFCEDEIIPTFVRAA